MKSSYGMKRIYFLIAAFLQCLIFCFSKFNVYSDNGGTIVAIAGRDYCLVAADTRLSDGYCISSRNVSRIFQIGRGETIFASAGCHTDVIEVAKVLEMNSKIYTYENGRDLRIEPFASLLAHILFQRRYFPYMSYCVAGGLSAAGCGKVFHYDVVGSYESVPACCAGKGQKIIQSLLDEVIDANDAKKIMRISHEDGDQLSDICYCTLTLAEAESAVIRMFQAACEREITIGDGIEMWVCQRQAENEIENQAQVIPKTLDRKRIRAPFHIRKSHIPLPRH